MTALSEPITVPLHTGLGQPEEEAAEPSTYVTFELSGQVFAVDVAHVREILDLQPIVSLPNAPGDLLGMVDVRDQAIAIVDLPGKLGLSAARDAQDGRILVFEMGAGPRTPIGVIADRVLGVVTIPDAEIEAAPAAMTRWDATVMRGVARVSGRLTMLLALNALFDDDTRSDFDFS